LLKANLILPRQNAGEVRSFVKFAGYFPAQLRDYINYEAAITNKVAAPSAATASRDDDKRSRGAALESRTLGTAHELAQTHYCGSRGNTNWPSPNGLANQVLLQLALRDFLFDHLVGSHKNSFRHGEPNRSCGFQIDHQLKLSGIFNWQLANPCAAEDTVHIERNAAE
jgi:hypothetical protein